MLSGVLLVLLCWNAVAVYFCMDFKRRYGENVYLTIANDRVTDGLGGVGIAVFLPSIFGFMEQDFSGWGWSLYLYFLVVAFWVGQAFSVYKTERRIKIVHAHSEVMKGRFHAGNRPATAATAERVNPTAAPDENPAFKFDPARFGT